MRARKPGRREKAEKPLPGPVCLRSLRIDPSRVEDWSVYPFHLPFVRGLDLRFDERITYFLGENGSGKSTLLEAIADLCRLPVEGGGKTEFDGSAQSTAPRSPLARALEAQFPLRPWDGYFVRAENLVRLADLLEQRERDPDFDHDPYFSYGGRSLHARSHGEAFLALFEHRIQPGGVVIMDEPEAALSPQRQLALLAFLDELVGGGTQVFIATHSPILMTFPGARLLAITETGIAETRLEDTSHYRITRGILEHPERYWRHLRGADPPAGP